MITAPASCARVVDPQATVTVSADAVVPTAAITSVDFFANNNLIGTATTPPYSIAWVPGAAGNYQR